MKRSRFVSVILIFSLFLVSARSYSVGSSFTVNSTSDGSDAYPGDGLCQTYSAGECTLRAAIEEANALGQPASIGFNIPGAAPYTITPAWYGFDGTVVPVVIDGTTQPGFSGTPLIELDGSNTHGDVTGLLILGGDSTVRGLVINRFSADGIKLALKGGDYVQGNYIGTDVTGTVDLGNGADGIGLDIGGELGVIGGSTPADRNVISGNEDNGIGIYSGSTGYGVFGNYIGVDVTGAAALGNSDSGIILYGAATDNTLGGNVISGNGAHGVLLVDAGTSRNVLVGNLIGTDAAGTSALANAGDGVAIYSGASDNVIGGPYLQSRNVISGNGGSGVTLSGTGTNQNVVGGNLIGTSASGAEALGNSAFGIVISGGAANNLVGGTTPGARNVLSGNGNYGLLFVDAGTNGNTAQGNFIGTDITGTFAVGNTNGGVGFFGGASDNLLGGSSAAARNLISGNGGDQGVSIGDDGTQGNQIKGNYIGTDWTGTQALGNAGNGLVVGFAPGNFIGGSAAGEGNLISGNGVHGIGIWGGSGTVVQGNYIGTDASGTAVLGNGADGVALTAGVSNAVLGGTGLAGNVISGNTADGIHLVDAHETTILGNYVGTDAIGTKPLGNSAIGIELAGGASGNTIGGTAPGAGNVISGNLDYGLSIWDGSSANVVEGNRIGTDITGSVAVANQNSGIVLAGAAANNVIGGTLSGAGNLVSGNGGYGMLLIDAGTTGNLVQGNYVGTDASGVSALANSYGGVSIFSGATDNLIGGTTPAARNLISGNHGDAGVNICCDGTLRNRVQGNFIGTDAAGTGPLGNGASGIIITVGASDNLVGGTAPGAGNVIAYNGYTGGVVYGDTSSGNAWLSNSIYSNGGMGIDLADNGVTPNDAYDRDSGPNQFQNFPMLTTAKNKGPTSVLEGSLASSGSTAFRVEFFASPACNSSGYGEGQTYLGFVNVTTNAAGRASFSIVLPVSTPLGSFITATATDPSGNTSEFSRCLVVKK